MGNVSYYTPEGYAKLKAELEHMKTVERAHVIKQIAEARDKGDLSENAEYDAAKEAQGMLELRIAKLEETLASARVVDASQLDNSKVLILSTVPCFLTLLSGSKSCLRSSSRSWSALR